MEQIKLITTKNAKKVIDVLQAEYPNAKPELEFDTPFELLIAVILSAQCTDKRVNIVTKTLFANYNTPKSIIALGEERLSEIIKPCGLHKSKAKNILRASQSLEVEFGGQVPCTHAQLLTLAGVGQKTANVVYSVAFNGNAIAVDTHVFRLAHRIGFSDGATPKKVEKDLCAILDESVWSKAHHCLIFHGRRVCKAQSPNCDNCAIARFCAKNGIKNKPNKSD